MSSSLLKKSLEIVEATLPKNQEKEKLHTTKAKKIKQKKKPLNRSKKIDSPASKIEENVRKCLLLSTAMEMDDDTAQKLIQRARSRKYVAAEQQKPKEDEPTVFTDEDFEKFEREYFCS